MMKILQNKRGNQVQECYNEDGSVYYTVFCKKTRRHRHYEVKNEAFKVARHLRSGSMPRSNKLKEDIMYLLTEEEETNE